MGERVHLTAQLTADRAPRAGDQHPLAGDGVVARQPDHAQLFSTDQGAHLEVAHVGTGDLALQCGEERWQVTHPHAVRSGPAAQRPNGADRHRGDGDDHDLGAGALQGVLQVVEGAEHLDALEPSTLLERVVVEVADGHEAEGPNPHQVAGQRGSRVAGPDDECRHPERVGRALSRNGIRHRSTPSSASASESVMSSTWWVVRRG
jgi:hypothetical protein